MTTIHARLSASSAKRWMNCPGSLNFIDSLPDFLKDTSSDFADEGTEAHAEGERCLVSGEDSSNEYVQVYLDAVREIAGEDSALFIEERVEFGKDMFGTADAIIVDFYNHSLNVVDLKYGVGVAVEAEDNIQMSAYALGATKKFGTGFDTITMTIVQPRGHHEKGPVRSWTVPIAYLEEFEQELTLAAARVDAPNAPLSAGSWCKFCPGVSTCPAYKSALIEGMANHSLAASLETAQMLGTWKASLNRVAWKCLIEGRPIAGLKLVEGRSTRKWKDAIAASEALKDRPEAFTSPVLKSPAQIESAMKKEGKAFTKEHAFKPRGNPTVASAKDKRPEFSRASADFADLVFESPEGEEEIE